MKYDLQKAHLTKNIGVTERVNEEISVESFLMDEEMQFVKL